MSRPSEIVRKNPRTEKEMCALLLALTSWQRSCASGVEGGRICFRELMPGPASNSGGQAYNSTELCIAARVMFIQFTISISH